MHKSSYIFRTGKVNLLFCNCHARFLAYSLSIKLKHAALILNFITSIFSTKTVAKMIWSYSTNQEYVLIHISLKDSNHINMKALSECFYLCWWNFMTHPLRVTRLEVSSAPWSYMNQMNISSNEYVLVITVQQNLEILPCFASDVTFRIWHLVHRPISIVSFEKNCLIKSLINN